MEKQYNERIQDSRCNEEIERKQPDYRDLENALKERGYLAYGEIVPGKLLRDLTGLSGDRLKLFLIDFWTLLENEHNLLITERGISDDGIRFLEHNECAPKVKKDLISDFKRIKRRARVLANQGVSGLSEAESAFHNHTQNRAAIVARHMQNELMQDRFF